MDLAEQKAKVKSELCITGCEKCSYFVETDRAGKGWRQYCGLGNFNLNRASYEVQKTSHNKNKQVTQAKFECEFDIPNRCPLLDDNARSMELNAPIVGKIFNERKKK